jgi:hypothetical protein
MQVHRNDWSAAMKTRGNLGLGERAVSAVLGVALSMLAAGRRSTILRILAGVAGASLLARSVAGHCAMKAALKGESSFRDGLSEQWRHTRVVAANLRQASERMSSASDRGGAGDGREWSRQRRSEIGGDGQTARQAADAAAGTY